MFSQERTDKNPAKTDTNPESLHGCREAEKMANTPRTWRTRGGWACDMANGAGHTPATANPDGQSDRRSQWPLPASSRLTEQLRRRALQHLDLTSFI